MNLKETIEYLKRCIDWQKYKNKGTKMNIENEVCKLKSDIFWLKVILTIVVLTLGVIAIGENNIHNKIVAKTAEIASKTNVECVTKTNTLFGVMNKIILAY